MIFCNDIINNYNCTNEQINAFIYSNHCPLKYDFSIDKEFENKKMILFKKNNIQSFKT